MPVGVGVEGELLIGGPGVAKGYLGRDDLTARKFISNPFESDGSDPILYRTGDVVEIDTDRKLVFKGRIDDQIKIHGFRVELGEIDACLSNVPGVSVAATVLLKEAGDDRLIAYLVTKTEVNRAHLRQILQKRLPSYMVPMRFERVNFATAVAVRQDRPQCAAQAIVRVDSLSVVGSVAVLCAGSTFTICGEPGPEPRNRF